MSMDMQTIAQLSRPTLANTLGRCTHLIRAAPTTAALLQPALAHLGETIAPVSPSGSPWSPWQTYTAFRELKGFVDEVDHLIETRHLGWELTPLRDEWHAMQRSLATTATAITAQMRWGTQLIWRAGDSQRLSGVRGLLLLSLLRQPLATCEVRRTVHVTLGIDLSQAATYRRVSLLTRGPTPMISILGRERQLVKRILHETSFNAALGAQLGMRLYLASLGSPAFEDGRPSPDEIHRAWIPDGSITPSFARFLSLSILLRGPANLQDVADQLTADAHIDDFVDQSALGVYQRAIAENLVERIQEGSDATIFSLTPEGRRILFGAVECFATFLDFRPMAEDRGDGPAR
jgi:hypothetical protein